MSFFNLKQFFNCFFIIIMIFMIIGTEIFIAIQLVCKNLGDLLLVLRLYYFHKDRTLAISKAKYLFIVLRTILLVLTNPIFIQIFILFFILIYIMFINSALKKLSLNKLTQKSISTRNIFLFQTSK